MTQSSKLRRSGTLLLAFMFAIAGIAFVEPRPEAAAAPGDPLSLTITLPGAETWGIHLYGTVCVKVDWGDTTSSDPITSAGTLTHSYAGAGTYSVTVSPGTGCTPSTYLTQFGATNPSATHKDYNSRIVSVESFGELGIRSLNDAFRGATSLTTVPSTLPSSVISLEGTFLGATAFDDDISGWLPEGNGVKYLHEMFELATSFNQDISSWDVSGVLTMDEMFDGAGSAMAFNQDLSSWDFSGLDRDWATQFNNEFGASLSTPIWWE